MTAAEIAALRAACYTCGHCAYEFWRITQVPENCPRCASAELRALQGAVLRWDDEAHAFERDDDAVREGE